MTTLDSRQIQEYRHVEFALRLVARRWWWIRLTHCLLLWLAGSAVLLLAAAAFSGYANLSSQARLAMLVGLLAGPTLGAALTIVLACRRMTPQQAARQIEQRLGGQENRFINAVQLADNGSLFEPELVRRTIDEIARETSDVPVERAVTSGRLIWSAGVAVIVGVVLLACLVLDGDRFGNGLKRLFAYESTGYVGGVSIDEVRPGNVPGSPGDRPPLPGKTITFRVTAHSLGKLDNSTKAILWTGGPNDKLADFKAREMPAVGGPINPNRPGGVYAIDLVLTESFRYYVQVGDTVDSNHVYTVTVDNSPLLADRRMQLTYPPYLAGERPAEPKETGTSGETLNWPVPLGTTAQVSVKLNRPVRSAAVTIDAASGAETKTMVPLANASRDSRDWSGDLGPLLAGQYQAVLRKPAELSSRSSQEEYVGTYNITTMPDDPPSVEIRAICVDAMVKPGGSFDVRIAAKDDHRLDEVRLFVAKVKSPGRASDASQLVTGPALVRHAWTQPDLLDSKGLPRKQATITYTFELTRGQANPWVRGDQMILWAEATDSRDLRHVAQQLGLDNDGRPQTRASEKIVITVRDPAEVAAAQEKHLQRLTAELTALLKEQVAVRASTVPLAPATGHSGPASQPAVADFAKSATIVRQGQAAFAEHLLRLAKGLIVPFDAETKSLQTSLLVLAYNDSAAAKSLADTLVSQVKESAQPAGAAQPVRKLVACQDSVIYQLQSLLGLIGQIEKRTEVASSRPDSSELPPDVRDKWKKLAEDLDKFIDQQRKEIADTRSLVKKPGDDFSDPEKLKLEELANNQDKWEKFLNDKISDFSKLAEQDFSNPALLKELIELKDDVVMAKDALKKKATEIAVPLEEAGLEMAEALTTHIEKWLPDSPDREKWSMEEPTEQKDTPMAELPKELEDMVGELMEEEEDLFEDLEDATSKWTDSLDKGAGWDAMDGPISNMSAQGVTGNRLPNTSEISGRSGEGRTGKSGGEMVENEATGKGGRKTETRLSNDPAQSGQVKDSSKEPPGGATGGGKVSGVAGEGLEGPVPKQLEKELDRLKDKQAVLRNKAEAVDARFRANNFNNFALSKVITLMRSTEQDLANYRYQNALRKKAVVINNLQAQKMLLHGDIMVHSDTSADLPGVQRKDVRDVDDSDLPRCRGLAKEYLKSLNEEASPAAPAARGGTSTSQPASP